MEYNPKEIEPKWQKYWEEHNTFHTDVWDFSKPKYYVLDMFPYPSGVGLHAGHPEGYTATDIVSRMKRMQGYNVLHPMGYDSFGLPAEQYAVSTGNHPDGFTEKNIETFTKQLKELGFDYDWSKMVKTSDPSYYHWTQWIFKQLYLDGYAKYVDMPVNWCEELGTVLSNDEVIDGKSERGGYPVIRKNMKQWVIDQQAFAEELLSGLDEIDWPQSTKEIQRNWIGRSEGVEVDFKIVGGGQFSIYTTCIETIYGITFMVLAPDGETVKELMPRIQNKEAVQDYINETLKKTDMDRTELNKGKSGCPLEGIMAINPVNGKEVPVYIGDFVLGGYGTGAVMAVPSHDQRDFEYAQFHNLPMIQVISGADVSEKAFEKQDYLGKDEPRLMNSAEFDGLTVAEAKVAITDKLVKEGVARKTVNYRFREWIFARQRYWGEPMPIVYVEDGSIHVLDDDELPLVLPVLEDYKGKSGKAPLDNATEWKKYDHNGIKGTRETSTMPGSAGSSWYYFRYIDPDNDKEFADQKLLEHWMPVDLYVGGPEHAVGHLMYSRIWNRYLYNKGLSPVKEPFKKLVHQGMILGANGIKMGKRFPEFVINPSDIVEKYGADTLRLYEMFMGALEASKPWSDQGVEGARRFINKVWNYFSNPENISEDNSDRLTRLYHQSVRKITHDFETLGFNTAIAQMMIFMNEAVKGTCPKAYAEGFVKMFSCVCPHSGEELWSILGHTETLALEKWPEFDEALCKEDVIEIGVQVNGKVRGAVGLTDEDTQDTALEKAKEIPSVAKAIADKNIVKVIYVKGKILNLIVK